MKDIKRKILLVDDCKLSQILFQDEFANRDEELFICGSGTEALEFIRHTYIDFICSAELLSDMDGIVLCQKIRELTHFAYKPFVILTFQTPQDPLKSALPAGVTGIFYRDDITQLLAFIKRFPFSATQVQGHILYVEGQQSLREQTSAMLQQHGLTVDAFASADEAWPHFLENDYDIVLTDIVLEGVISGLGLVNQIRRQAGEKGDTPILAITAFDDMTRRIELFNLGVTDYIAKPVVDEELFARINGQIAKTSLIKQLSEIKHQQMQEELNTAANKLETLDQRLKDTEALWHDTLETAPDGMIVCNDQHQILLVNAQTEKLFGYARDELLGQSVDMLIPLPLREAHARHQQNYHQQPKMRAMGQSLGITGQRKDGSVFPVEISLSPHRHQGQTIVTASVRDVSERKHNEELLKRHQRALSVLSTGNHTLLHSIEGDENQLLHAMCQVATKVGGYRMAWIGYPAEDEQKTVRIMAHAGFEEGYLQRAAISWGENKRGQGPAGLAIRSGQIQTVKDVATDPRMVIRREDALKQGYSSCIALPLKDKDSIFGVLMIYAETPDVFDEAEVAILEEMAADLAFGIVSQRNNIGREKAEKELKASLALLESTLESTADGIVVTSLTADILKYNSRFAKLWGLPAVTNQPATCDQLVCCVGERVKDAASFVERTHRMYQDSLALFEDEIELKDGRIIQRIGYPHYMDGAVVGRVCSLRDITELKNHEKQLIYFANHDGLTGLPNRNLLNDRLGQAIAYAARSHELVAVLFFDLDRFKLINDGLGHCIGDQVLIEIAKRLPTCLREEDTVARMGGDEFVVLLPNPKREEDVAGLALKLLNIIAMPCLIDSRELIAEASIGIALYPRDGGDVDTLLRHADAAMYRAKDHGGHTFAFYKDGIDAQVNRHLEIAGQLQLALERNEFSIYYQPQYDLSLDRITGAEALIRWHHPSMGLVSPAEFIPIAEESNCILKIGAWVAETVIKQCQAWQSAGLSDFAIAINISARQFNHTDLSEILSALISQYDLDTATISLELELTEGMLIKHPEQVIQTLNELKAMNFRIAIDDFGTGYSSLAYLKRFPIDKLKIDRSFVKDTPGDLEDVAIASAIIVMAHELGMKVVAEGVETEAQLAFLKSRGCDVIQGYLTGRPMVAEEFGALLSTQPLPVKTADNYEPDL